MENNETIDALNKLIVINNDRVEGYKTATEETDEGDLKILFSRFSDTSEKCLAELNAEVLKLGGEPSESTKLTGKVFRVWMDLKSAITGKDRLGILDSCSYGEESALMTYVDVLKESGYELSAEHRAMINSQHTWLKADYDHVNAMREALEVE